ncbi:MAG TPA: transaldolase [Acidimicrobiales bacterium]|nr:transaldolase [Acidimicrobiales bacterium]
MTRLQQLFDEHGQSPWLDNLRRRWLHDGTLARRRDAGVRGVTANPTIVARAIEGSPDYDEQFRTLLAQGRSVQEACWELILRDVEDALEVFRPVHEQSGGTDGFVSVEVAPALAHDTRGTIAAARDLHDRMKRPNLFVKIPATAEGVPAIEAMIAEGRNINVTLLFSLERYGDVIEAYLRGLEAYQGDLANVHSVASFFVSRVDTEVDRRLDAAGGPAAAALRGRAAIAQARLAYQLFRSCFAGERWERLARRGAHVQRPLWASTSTKDPAYADTRYVDALIGPDTVTTLPEETIDRFEDHGTVRRSLDGQAEVEQARTDIDALGAAGVDMADVGATLEAQGVAAFARSFDELLAQLSAKAAAWERGGHRAR